jgi:hypothetical protein
MCSQCAGGLLKTVRSITNLVITCEDDFGDSLHSVHSKSAYNHTYRPRTL